MKHVALAALVSVLECGPTESADLALVNGEIASARSQGCRDWLLATGHSCHMSVEFLDIT